jgi:opacity protein-like surface antigen
MKPIHLILPIVAASSLATTAMADDGNFAGILYGQTSSNYNKSTLAEARMPGVNFDRVIRENDTWGVRFGQESDGKRYYVTYDYASRDRTGLAKIRQSALYGSFDLLRPIADQTRVFLGVSAGLTEVKRWTDNHFRESNIGPQVGMQAGFSFLPSDTMEVEAGYRYARHTGTDMDFLRRNTLDHEGSLNLKRTGHAYVGLNWRF